MPPGETTDPRLRRDQLVTVPASLLQEVRDLALAMHETAQAVDAHGDRVDGVGDRLAMLDERFQTFAVRVEPALMAHAAYVGAVLARQQELGIAAEAADAKARKDRAEARAIWWSRAKVATPVVLALLGWAIDHFLHTSPSTLREVLGAGG